MVRGKVSIRFVLLATPLIAAGLILLLSFANLGIWQRLQLLLEDGMQQRVAGDADADPRIVLVAIDDAALLAQKRNWPWPRSTLARLIERINAGAPRVLGLDILLSEPMPSDPGGDAALAAAIAKTRTTVLLEKMLFEDRDAGPRLISPLPAFARHAVTGFFNFSTDSDQVVRRQRMTQPIGEQVRRCFACQLYRTWQGPAAAAETPDVVRIAYRSPKSAFVRLSAHDVLVGKIPPATFRDRMVLIGATFSDAGDSYMTPIQDERGSAYMAGVAIHANVVAGLIDRRWLREVPPRLTHLLCLALLAGIACATALGSRRRGGLLTAGGIVVAAVVFWGLFSVAGVLLPLVPLVVTIALAFGIGRGGKHLLSMQERRSLQNMIKVSVDLADGGAEASIEGEPTEREITVCFIDIENLPGVAASLIQRSRGRYLTSYFSGVSSILRRYHGLLTEDLAIGVIGVFGVEARQTDHAARACRAAVALQRTMAQMAEHWRQDVGVAFEARIGVHTAPVTIQSCKQHQRLQHTLVGAELYLASRIARWSKQFGSAVIASEDTIRRLEQELRTERVGELEVRGRKDPLGVHCVLDDGGCAS